jgi:aspartokinase-like uncharacterized kinase
MDEGLTVVKVGGSLFGLANLGRRLHRWLEDLGAAHTLLVAGGGRAADMVRDLDREYGLGEEAAHWLALRALSLTAHFLQALLPDAHLISELSWPLPFLEAGRPLVLNPYEFIRADEGRPGCLAHSWDVTSDAIAARAAAVSGAKRLVLLKSVPVPMTMNWEEAARLGFVDRAFARVVNQAPALAVTVVNFRKEM